MAALYTGRIAVIGGGVMGTAIVSGWIAASAVEPSAITIVEPSDERRAELAEAVGGVAIAADAAVALPADLVLLAVKPQILETVLAGIAGHLAGSLVVSIAAGFSTARLESLAPEGTSVVRVMPNTPAQVRQGMALVSAGASASAEQAETVRQLFAAIGDAVVVEERHQNAGTAISGSGPAYFALVVDALARAGVAQGLPRAVAQRLAVQTMRGTAELLEQTAMHPEMLIDGVSSPGGTTIAAVNVLESRGVRAAFNDAVRANVARAEELG